MILRTSSVFAAPYHTHFLLRATLTHRAVSRFASTQTKPSSQTSSAPPPAKKQTELAARVNPPESTLPAPLEIPEREPDQNYFSYLLRSGKAYLTFYKTGIKNVWANHKLANAVQARYDQELKKKEQETDNAGGATATATLLTRADFQLLRRSRHDMRRVPVFAVLLLLLGEWLPLVVVFMTRLVPRPCRIPKQIEKDRAKRQAVRHWGAAELAQKHSSSSSTSSTTTAAVPDAGAAVKPRDMVLYYNRAFGLCTPIAATLFAPLQPTVLLALRAARHLQYLMADDRLLSVGGGQKGLRDEEVRFACDERGLDVLGKDVQTLRRELDDWLKNERSKALMDEMRPQKGEK